MLLQKFDHKKDAAINPEMIHRKVKNFPETVISVFSHHLFDRIVDFLCGKVIAFTKDVDGVWPIYEANYKGHRLLCTRQDSARLLAFELACKIEEENP